MNPAGGHVRYIGCQQPLLVHAGSWKMKNVKSLHISKLECGREVQLWIQILRRCHHHFYYTWFYCTSNIMSAELWY